MKGYKVMNPDFTCKGFQFEIGKTYTHEGEIEMCGSGFHFCLNAADCFSYYAFTPNNVVCEVEAIGKVIEGDDKSVTNKIKIIRQLSWDEVLTICNLGKGNTGLRNSGDSNSGDSNSGDRNSGDRNSGDWNSGNWNSGDSNSGDSNSGDSNSRDRNSGDSNSGYRNSGDSNSGDRNSGDSNSGYRNSGDRNSGDSNSGYRNSGDRNSGDWNSGNWNSGDSNSGDSNSGYRNSGAFCTDNNPKVFLFNKEANMTVREWEESRARDLMSRLLNPNIWIWSNEMTKEEKEDHPEHKTTEGYLKTISLKEAWANMWGNLTDKDKEAFTTLPNFDAKIFEEITGINI